MSAVTLDLTRDNDALWLHVSNGHQHGSFNIGKGLRADGQEVLAVQLLREYIAQNVQAGGAVSDEAVGKLRSWIVSKTGMRIHPVELRAALEAIAPLLRAPAEQGGSAVSPRMDNAAACTPTMEQGGRVDGFDAWWKSLPKVSAVSPETMSDTDFARFVWDAALAAQGQGEVFGWVITDGEGGYFFRKTPPSDFDREWAAKYNRHYTPVFDAPAASPAGVPDGMALVPRTPTIEMVAAGHDTYLGAPNMACFGLVWKAMLAAAPSQPEDAA